MTATGLLRDEGPGGDQSLFKGILIRYLVPLINDSDVDIDIRSKMYDFIEYNATVLWSYGVDRDADLVPSGLFSPDWSMSAGDAYTIKGSEYATPQQGWQVSGATLMEAMNVVENPQ